MSYEVAALFSVAWVVSVTVASCAYYLASVGAARLNAKALEATTNAAVKMTMEDAR